MHLINWVGRFSFSKYPVTIFLLDNVSVTLSSPQVTVHLNTAKCMKYTHTIAYFLYIENTTKQNTIR